MDVAKVLDEYECIDLQQFSLYKKIVMNSEYEENLHQPIDEVIEEFSEQAEKTIPP